MHLITRRVNRIARRYYWEFLERYFLDFVFIHINKTGGTSVEKALQVRFQHKTAMEKIEELGQALWEKKFTFCVVRNPWDRVVSHYHYRVITNQTNLGNNPISFNEWVSRAYGVNDPKYYDIPKMFMPQVDWITDSIGKIIVDYVARFENLQNDFKHICKHLSRKANLPHLKKSNRGNYRKYYNIETIEVVSKWFQKDIVQFGYKFE